MQKRTTLIAIQMLAGIVFFSNCNEKKAEAATTETPVAAEKNDYGGYDSKEKWGAHLVTIAGCNDCHTPKKMSPMGPVLDSSLLLSGHPEKMPAPVVNRKEIESKGYGVTQTLTAWVGPWGISFAGNLTPDSTGTGNWTESQFQYALRKGKFKGLPNNRPLLPPMPWDMYQHMTDGEISAVFAFLRSIKPIKNVVPAAIPPVSALPGK